MEKGLIESGGPWLMGEMLTLADYCIAPTIDRMNDLGLGDTWRDLPKVCDWYERIKAQPAYAKTFYKGTRLSEIYDSADYGTAENPATVVKD